MTGDPVCRDSGVCVTCADALDAVVVEWISDDGRTVRGHAGDTLREVSVELLDGVRVGDTVLEHGGVAMQLATEAGGGSR